LIPVVPSNCSKLWQPNQSRECKQYLEIRGEVDGAGLRNRLTGLENKKRKSETNGQDLKT